jgi:nucleotide-binding universal stress UspA family protein
MPTESTGKMYDRILVPTDGSEGTTKTLEHALSIAADNDATLHVLYVVDQRLYLAAEEGTQDEIVATLEERGRNALDLATEQADASDVAVVTEQRQGIPHKEILGYTSEAGIDLIAMGTHGRTGRDRLAALGSVTDRVVENADVPVLVVDIADGADES